MEGKLSVNIFLLTALIFKIRKTNITSRKVQNFPTLCGKFFCEVNKSQENKIRRRKVVLLKPKISRSIPLQYHLESLKNVRYGGCEVAFSHIWSYEVCYVIIVNVLWILQSFHGYCIKCLLINSEIANSFSFSKLNVPSVYDSNDKLLKIVKSVA